MSVPTQPLSAPEPSPGPWSTLDEYMRAVVAMVVLAGFFGYLALVTIRAVRLPGDTLGMILGSLITLSGGVVGFYFQTTLSSALKDRTIAKQATK